MSIPSGADSESIIPKELNWNDRFFWSLGFFVAGFSRAETMLQAVLWHLSGIEAPTAQAVLSGIRTDGAMSYIRRIADAEKWRKKRREQMDFIFVQLAHINKLRNDLLHYGAGVDDVRDLNKFLISNEGFVHTSDRVRKTYISPELLERAANDLHRITAHLFAFAWPDEMDWSRRWLMREVLRRPWRYTPPQPSPRRRRSRKIPPRQQRPPRPSRT